MMNPLEFVSSSFADIAAGEPLRPATAGDKNTSRRSARGGNASNNMMINPKMLLSSSSLPSLGRLPVTPGNGSLVPELDEKPLDQYTPRTAYDMKRRMCGRLTLNLIMTLDVGQIRNIRNAFMRFKDEVSLPEFVQIMRTFLRVHELGASPQMMVWSLVELFHSMDLDGDNNLRFDEFLATIVHLGMGAADHLVVHPIKPYFAGHEYRGARGITDQLISYHAIPDIIVVSERSNRLVKIIEPHSMRVRRAIYVGNSTLSAVEFLPASTLLHLTSGSPITGRTTSSLPGVSSVAMPAGGLLSPVTSSSPLSPAFSPQSLGATPNGGAGHRKKFSSSSMTGGHGSNGNDGSPRSVSQLRTVEENKLLPAKLRAKARRQQQVDEDLKKIDLLAACTTQYLYLWEGVAASSGPVLVAEEIKTSHPITVLKWIPEHSRLYAGTSIGTVDAYEIIYEHRDTPGVSLSSAVPHLHRVRTFQAHTDCVTAITHIPGMEMLLTSSLDAKIYMWDLASPSHSKPKLKFTSHRAGVVDLAYSDSYRFLLSASIDHEVGVWSPFADRLVFKLIGHGAPLIGVQFVQGTPQIVSADVQGWIKVWDTRNFSCVQTFMSSERITSFTTCDSYHRRIVVAGRMKQWLCYDQEGGPHMSFQEADDPAFHCIFNPTTVSFATISRKDVKIWNALNGRLSRIYRGLSDSEVTAACLDGRQRKLIIGDQAGKIRVFNYQTGSYMKSLQAHDGEVSYLGYCNNDRTVVSVGKIDRCIKLHDERPIEDQHVLFTVACPHEVTATAFSESLKLIAAAGMDGNIYLWRLGKGVVEGQCKGRGEQILSLQFLQDYPLLIAGDQSGEITIWVVPHITSHGTRSHNDTSAGSSNGNSGFTGLTSSTAHCVRAMAFMNKGTKRPACGASAFALDNARLRLYSGDLEGDIHVWDLKQVLVWVDADRGGRTGLIRSLHQHAAAAAVAAAAAATSSSSTSSAASSSSSAASPSLSISTTMSVTGGGSLMSPLPAGSLISSTLSSMSRSNALYGRGGGASTLVSSTISGGAPPTSHGVSFSPVASSSSLLSSSSASSSSSLSYEASLESALLAPLLSPSLSRRDLKDQIKNWCKNATPTFSVLSAHPSAISTLELTREPACLLSSARHHRVGLWSPDNGRPMGSLDSSHARSMKDDNKSINQTMIHASSEWLFHMDMAKRELFDQRLNADLFTVLDKEKEEDLAVVTLLEKMEAEKEAADNRRIDDSRAEWAANIRPLTSNQHTAATATSGGTNGNSSTTGRLHAMSFAETDSHRDATDGATESDGELVHRLLAGGTSHHDDHRTASSAHGHRSSSAMSDYRDHNGGAAAASLTDIKEETKRDTVVTESKDDSHTKLPILPAQSLSPLSHAHGQSASHNDRVPTDGTSSPPPAAPTPILHGSSSTTAADTGTSGPTLPQWKAPNARRGSVIMLTPMFAPSVPMPVAATPTVQPAAAASGITSETTSTLVSVSDDIISNRDDIKSNATLEPPIAPIGLSPGTATGARPGTEALPQSVPRSSHDKRAPMLIGSHNPIDEQQLAHDRERAAQYDAALTRLEGLNMPYRATIDYVGVRAGTDEEDEHAWRTHFIARKTNPFANAGKSRGLAEQLARRLRQRERDDTHRLRHEYDMAREAERLQALYGTSGNSTPGVLSLPSTADGHRSDYNGGVGGHIIDGTATDIDGHQRRDSVMSSASVISSSTTDMASKWQEDDDTPMSYGGGGAPRQRSSITYKGDKSGKFGAASNNNERRNVPNQVRTKSIASPHSHHGHGVHAMNRVGSLNSSSSMPSLLSTLSTGVVIPGVGMTLTSVPARRLSHHRSFSRANADLLTSPVFAHSSSADRGGSAYPATSDSPSSAAAAGILSSSTPSAHRSAGHTRGASVTFAQSVVGGELHDNGTTSGINNSVSSPSRSRRTSLNKPKEGAFPADNDASTDTKTEEVKDGASSTTTATGGNVESPEVRELREALLAHKIATAGNEALSAHRTGVVAGHYVPRYGMIPQHNHSHHHHHHHHHHHTPGGGHHHGSAHGTHSAHGIHSGTHSAGGAYPMSSPPMSAGGGYGHHSGTITGQYNLGSPNHTSTGRSTSQSGHGSSHGGGGGHNAWPSQQSQSQSSIAASSSDDRLSSLAHPLPSPKSSGSTIIPAAASSSSSTAAASSSTTGATSSSVADASLSASDGDPSGTGSASPTSLSRTPLQHPLTIMMKQQRDANKASRIASVIAAASAVGNNPLEAEKKKLLRRDVPISLIAARDRDMMARLLKDSNQPIGALTAAAANASQKTASKAKVKAARDPSRPVWNDKTHTFISQSAKAGMTPSARAAAERLERALAD